MDCGKKKLRAGFCGNSRPRIPHYRHSVCKPVGVAYLDRSLGGAEPGKSIWDKSDEKGAET